MHVEVVAFPPYRAGLGARNLRLELADGSTLRDALTALARRSSEFEPFATARKDEWLWGQLLVHAARRDGPPRRPPPRRRLPRAAAAAIGRASQRVNRQS